MAGCFQQAQGVPWESGRQVGRARGSCLGGRAVPCSNPGTSSLQPTAPGWCEGLWPSYPTQNPRVPPPRLSVPGGGLWVGQRQAQACGLLPPQLLQLGLLTPRSQPTQGSPLARPSPAQPTASSPAYDLIHFPTGIRPTAQEGQFGPRPDTKAPRAGWAQRHKGVGLLGEQEA